MKDIPHGLKHLIHLRPCDVCVDCQHEGHTPWGNVFTVTKYTCGMYFSYQHEEHTTWIEAFTSP